MPTAQDNQIRLLGFQSRFPSELPFQARLYFERFFERMHYWGRLSAVFN